MELAFNPISISTLRKLASILLSVVIFAFLAGLTTLAVGRPVIFGIIHAIFVGSGVGFFEQFYVQTPRGRWLRSMHPVRSIFLYSIVVVTLYIISFHLSHVILWRFEDLPMAYHKLPIAIPLVHIFSDRHCRYASRSFYWDRNLVSSDARHLSPPGNPGKSAVVSRYQQFHRLGRTFGSSPHAISSRQIPVRRVKADHRLRRRYLPL